MPDDVDEQEFGTAEERAQAIVEIKKWAESFDYGCEPMIFLDAIGKTFTPRKLAGDMADGTALGEVILGIIISESKRTMTSPLEYTKRLMKTAHSFPKVPRQDLN